MEDKDMDQYLTYTPKLIFLWKNWTFFIDLLPYFVLDFE